MPVAKLFHNTLQQRSHLREVSEVYVVFPKKSLFSGQEKIPFKRAGRNQGHRRKSNSQSMYMKAASQTPAFYCHPAVCWFSCRPISKLSAEGERVWVFGI